MPGASADVDPPVKAFLRSSPAGLTGEAISSRKKMECRVKQGNDETRSN
jgi:hypothetical protein